MNLNRSVTIAVLGLAMIFGRATAARAQHGDYILGTAGVLAAQQAPEGIFYTNLWSWYHASNSSFLQTGPIKCGPIAGRVCLSANFNASGNLDMFVDQNFLTIVTPFKILGATYGFLVD
ncbi:MAG: hypothetical protein ACREQC_00345, partial [Candidatus Binataceae bacterium]